MNVINDDNEEEFDCDATENYDWSIQCKNCLCSYRRCLFISTGIRYTYHDFSIKARILLEYIREYDRHLINKEDIPLSVEKLPLFLFQENTIFQEYGIIYPNFLFLMGIRRTNKEFKSFLNECDTSLMYDRMGGLTLFTILFCLKEFKKCLYLLKEEYIPEHMDRIVFFKYDIDIKNKTSLQKKIKKKLKI